MLGKKYQWWFCFSVLNNLELRKYVLLTVKSPAYALHSERSIQNLAGHCRTKRALVQKLELLLRPFSLLHNSDNIGHCCRV